LLRILMQSPNRMFSRAELETRIWGEELGDSDSLRAHIYTLRRALAVEGETNLVETVHGLGYRLTVGHDSAP
jgi:DNA-binding winged helix-turn-helix (wHTH) protein